MPDRDRVAGHYTHGGLLEAIREGLTRLGKTPDEVSVEDLGPVDEFHIGGQVATESFLDQLDIGAAHHVLDVGCGLGGSGRFAAQRYGCRVTGVDLTPEYVETGISLCAWVGLADRVRIERGDATALDHEDEAFDRVYLIHVGMNIAEKHSLAAELHRVVRRGGKVGIYDIMRVGEGELRFPVPWATGPEGSSLASPGHYREAMEEAGFRIVAQRERRDFALEFFAELQARVAASGGPPPLGLHTLMGASVQVKLKNMIDGISRNLIAPVELVAEKPSRTPSAAANGV